jgi:hypothetical protein
MKTKVVTDKHLDGAAIGRVLGRFVMSAASHKPTNKHPYRGKHQDDEDYTEVLQLAWENECPLLTGDAAMIERPASFDCSSRRWEKNDACEASSYSRRLRVTSCGFSSASKQARSS